jgi:hypothetical protein
MEEGRGGGVGEVGAGGRRMGDGLRWISTPSLPFHSVASAPYGRHERGGGLGLRAGGGRVGWGGG